MYVEECEFLGSVTKFDSFVLSVWLKWVSPGRRCNLQLHAHVWAGARAELWCHMQHVLPFCHICQMDLAQGAMHLLARLKSLKKCVLFHSPLLSPSLSLPLSFTLCFYKRKSHSVTFARSIETRRVARHTRHMRHADAPLLSGNHQKCCRQRGMGCGGTKGH